MKIVVLGLIVVAIVNVAFAAPSDKGGKADTENETSKAQLNMVLEQMKDLRHQLQRQQQQQQQQQEQQNLINKLMEEQQEQLKVQQSRDEELQRRDEEQQEKITKIERTRRSDNETEQHLRELILAELEPLSVEHIKKLVLAEIKPTIDVLSECAIGNYSLVHPGGTKYDRHFETKTISFGKTFSRIPKVIVSVAGQNVMWKEVSTWFALRATVQSPTTTKFDLEIMRQKFNVYRVDFTWIACA